MSSLYTINLPGGSKRSTWAELLQILAAAALAMPEIRQSRQRRRLEEEILKAGEQVPEPAPFAPQSIPPPAGTSLFPAMGPPGVMPGSLPTAAPAALGPMAAALGLPSGEPPALQVPHALGPTRSSLGLALGLAPMLPLAERTLGARPAAPALPAGAPAPLPTAGIGTLPMAGGLFPAFGEAAPAPPQTTVMPGALPIAKGRERQPVWDFLRTPEGQRLALALTFAGGPNLMGLKRPPYQLTPEQEEQAVLTEAKLRPSADITAQVAGRTAVAGMQLNREMARIDQRNDAARLTRDAGALNRELTELNADRRFWWQRYYESQDPGIADILDRLDRLIEGTQAEQKSLGLPGAPPIAGEATPAPPAPAPAGQPTAPPAPAQRPAPPASAPGPAKAPPRPKEPYLTNIRLREGDRLAYDRTTGQLFQVTTNPDGSETHRPTGVKAGPKDSFEQRGGGQVWIVPAGAGLPPPPEAQSGAGRAGLPGFGGTMTPKLTKPTKAEQAQKDKLEAQAATQAAISQRAKETQAAIAARQAAAAAAKAKLTADRKDKLIKRIDDYFELARGDKKVSAPVERTVMQKPYGGGKLLPVLVKERPSLWSTLTADQRRTRMEAARDAYDELDRGGALPDRLKSRSQRPGSSPASPPAKPQGLSEARKRRLREIGRGAR